MTNIGVAAQDEREQQEGCARTECRQLQREGRDQREDVWGRLRRKEKWGKERQSEEN